ncbi:MAG: hypothetical protein IH969_03820 [Candidatus Krumholzibacteriota bacterium]|nr:hypothetical protein [Candidatus Krumholzibacteriota bacterium]
MHRWSAYILFFVTLAASGAALAQSTLPSVDLELRDNTLSRARLSESSLLLGGDMVREYRLEAYFLRHGTRVPSHSYLAQHPDRIYGLTRYELTPFETALQGAGMGMTVGLFAGAMASTFGAWDEGTSWYLAGALGTLGAILGGTYGANNDGFRIRYRFEPDE